MSKEDNEVVRKHESATLRMARTELCYAYEQAVVVNDSLFVIY